MQRLLRESTRADLFAALVSLLAIAATVNYLIREYREIHRNAAAEVERIANRVASSVANPLWSYDRLQVERLLDSELADPAVGWIHVVELEGSPEKLSNEFLHPNPQDSEAFASRSNPVARFFDEHPTGFYFTQRSVRREEKELGAVVVGLSVLDENQRLIERAIVVSFACLLIIVALIVTLYAFRRTTKALEAAVQASKVKDQFLANVSHELRTPMNGIIGLTSVLLESRPSGETREQLSLVLSSAKSLSVLLNDLLDSARLGAGKLRFAEEPFDPVQVLRDTVELARAGAQRREIEILIDAPESYQLLRGDAFRLRQILTNLLGNALKFCIERGVVILRARWAPGSSDAVKRFSLSIADTGVGVPKDKLPHLFGRFEQADTSVTRSFGGTGLGLSISRELARAMGGDVSLRSIQGVGTRVDLHIELPVVQEEYGVSSEHTPNAVSERCKNTVRGGTPDVALSVLVAEDNAVNQRVLSALLKKRGHRAVIVENGAEAIREVQGGCFDVVLMDLHMPVMGGLEATKRIRSGRLGKEPDVPIVILTADAFETTRTTVLEAGATDFLTKPLDIAELERVLGDVVETNRHGTRADALPEPTEKFEVGEKRFS